MRAWIILALAATTVTAGELWVINSDGKFDGRRYGTDAQQFREHHAQYDELCVWMDVAPDAVATNADGVITYRTPTADELAAASQPHATPVAIVAGLDTNGVPDGRTYSVYVVDGEIVTTLNSASPRRAWAQQQQAIRAAQHRKAAGGDVEDMLVIRACVVEDYADYVQERNAINTLADRVLGAGTGPRLPVETLAEYAQRRKDRYKQIRAEQNERDAR